MLLREGDKTEVQNRLKGMKEPVVPFYFTQQIAGACRTCYDTESLLKEVTPLSDKLSPEIDNFVTDVEDVRRFGIEPIPAICHVGGKDHGIRIYGIPSGSEFPTLIETLLHLSTRESGFTEETLVSLKTLIKPVRLQVFVTPTCIYCPRAEMTGVQLAMESDLISCDGVEISEYPDLAQKYGMMGVPTAVINRAVKNLLLVLIGKSHLSRDFDSSDGSPLAGEQFDSPPLAARRLMNRVHCDLRPLLAAEGHSLTPEVSRGFFPGIASWNRRLRPPWKSPKWSDFSTYMAWLLRILSLDKKHDLSRENFSF
jgi:glutaredoxin-like protein